MGQGARVPSLGWPFAAVGLVGGALCARAFGPHPFDLEHGGLAIVVATTLVARRLGARLSDSLAQQPAGLPCWWPEALGRILLGGAQTGLIVLGLVVASGLSARDPDWVLALFPGSAVAAAFGALVAVPFVPSLLAVTATHHRVGQARPGSLVAAALRLRVWLAVCVVTAMHVGLALHIGHPASPWRPSLVALERLLEGSLLVAAAGIPVLALLYGRAAGRVRSVAAAALGHRPFALPEGAPAPEMDERCLDLGVGEQRYGGVAPALDPYRDTQRPRVQLVGDPEVALAVLRDAAWSDAVVLASAMLPLGFLIGLMR